MTYEHDTTDDGCPMLSGDPPRTCDGCDTPLPRRKDGRPHRNRRWCSNGCRDLWVHNHVWQAARPAAIARDGKRCVRQHEDEDTVRAELEPRAAEINVELEAVERSSPRRWDLWEQARELDRQLARRVGAADLEVNHIDPRNGGGYAAGCHHHLDNLETLCHDHHVEETTRQRRGYPLWRDDPRPLEVIEAELAVPDVQPRLPL